MKFTAWYFIAVGALMFAQWGYFLAVGAVPELKTEPLRLAFHLAAELTTAIFLVVSGVQLLRGSRGGKNLALIGAGLLAYTAMVSPGYFAQRGEWPLVAMFVVLLALALVSAALLLRNRS